MDIYKIKKMYFSGIGGIGVSAMARYFQVLGTEVSGSDCQKSYVTDSLIAEGISVVFEQRKGNLSSDIDIHIYSPAVPANNLERLEAIRLGIPSYSYSEFLGILSQKFKTIAISGTNGKTSTTAMTSEILCNSSHLASAIVGSIVSNWQSNMKYGKGEYFVMEACEHQEHMLELSTYGTIITNIMEDHLDYYQDIDHIISAFQKFIDHTHPEGFVVTNFDDVNTQELQIKHKNHITFGFSHGADVHCDMREICEGAQIFDVYYKGKALGNVKITQPGEFNIYNALAAISTALYLNVPFEDIQATLAHFNGTWRRFEYIGTYNGAPIISDYGHHPDAIEKTLLAAREFYPKKRIVIAFQPHHHNRTKKLFTEFIEAFGGADYTIITEIFDVLGRENEGDQDISSRDLVDVLKSKGSSVLYTANLDELEMVLRKNITRDDVLLVVGAGDIYTVGNRLAT